jgi:hypothetical protein
MGSDDTIPGFSYSEAGGTGLNEPTIKNFQKEDQNDENQ